MSVSGQLIICFNPLPARRPGATSPGNNLPPLALFQSSPSPKAGSYLLVSCCVCGVQSFNPLPARRPGATPAGESVSRRQPVSILSQPEGRELREWGGKSHVIIRVSILSQPEGRELLLVSCCVCGVDKFQSSPSPKAGSYYHAMCEGLSYV